MKKKCTALVAAFALLFTTVFSGLSQPAFAAGTTNNDQGKVLENDYTFVKDSETGHIGVKDNGQAVISEDDVNQARPNAALPTNFQSYTEVKNKYPNTRNQGSHGTCWAHAATACAEFDLVKNHGKSKSIDLSELQLSYFHYNDGYIGAGLDGDSNYIPSSASKNYLSMGGNFLFSMHTLAQWKAFTSESSIPYSNAGGSMSIYGNQYHDQAQLRNVRYLDIKNNRNAVKQAIMDYGSAYISYGHDSTYYNLNGWSLYYCPNTRGTNHDVVIVGWDDNIPASSFKYTPPGNGAWLVRNSWSTNNSAGSESTYFYMSYYDKSLASTAYALDFEPGSQKDVLYQHDGSNTHGSISATTVANVFTANATDYPTQELKSVMIPFTSATNVNYEVKIYTGLTGTSPTSGYLNKNATTTGWTSEKGIYTINLKESVFVNAGERFSVVVKALNGPKNFDIETSQQVTYVENGTTKPWFTSVASADSGESFIYNDSWKDTTSIYNSSVGNLCIKVKSTNSSQTRYKITYNLNGGTNSASNPSGYLSSQTGTFTLNKPTRSGYHFLGWYTDSSFTNKVTAINYNNKQNVTLYARWCSNSNASKTTITKRATMTANGSYKVTCSNCGLVRSTTTTYKASSVKLSGTKLVYNGKKRAPYPVITTSNGTKLTNGTHYTYSYNQSTRTKTGRYSVTIKFKDKYSGSKTLYFTIVPKAPSSASAKLYGYDDIKVSWSKCTGASGYYVYYKKSSSSTYSSYKRTTANYVKFANLSDNVKYNFKVIPYYKSGDTRYKSTQSKVVSAITLKKLSQPSMYTMSNGRVSLTWNSISGASGYQVYWSKTKSGTYNKLCDYSNSASGISFNVGKGVTYWYKTRAYKTVDGKKIYGPFSTAKAYTK